MGKPKTPQYTGPDPEQVRRQSQQYDRTISELNRQNRRTEEQYGSLFKRTSEDYNARLAAMQQQTEAQRQYYDRLQTEQTSALNQQRDTQARLLDEQNKAIAAQNAQADKATSMGQRQQTEMLRKAQQVRPRTRVRGGGFFSRLQLP